jgi:hypothetical protein
VTEIEEVICANDRHGNQANPDPAINQLLAKTAKMPHGRHESVDCKR